MKKRIFWSILCTTLLMMTLCLGILISAFYSTATEERTQSLENEAHILAAIKMDDEKAYLTSFGRAVSDRITLIDVAGTVLYDNFAQPASMANHLDRPEVQQALTQGYGSSTRLSSTLGEQSYYYALALESGNVLRVSSSAKSIWGILAASAPWVLLLAVAMLAIAVRLASVLTLSIIGKINAIDLNKPLENDAYDELSPLLVKLDHQHKRIASQLEELGDKQMEFENITDTMSEALVIFSESRTVLSCNHSAQILFNEASGSNLNYLAFCRDPAYVRVTERAFAGQSASEVLHKNGRAYTLSANPVAGKITSAAVLFAIDITERENAEKMRREFSANVSHELKTPLTSIMGCAEILQNGIAKPADMPRFAGQIYSEANRLLCLIEDIIKLSQLDEGDLQHEYTAVNLHDISKTVQSELVKKAQQAGITLILTGTDCPARGAAQLLHEMIYNLCDNAIIYNKRGGSVTIHTELQNGIPVLTVKDTGIGIALEDQSRIFERFYRVDKSHSKETGGTGLGLSIVKHTAMLHGAQMALTSNLGEGTQVTLSFLQDSASIT